MFNFLHYLRSSACIGGSISSSYRRRSRSVRDSLPLAWISPYPQWAIHVSSYQDQTHLAWVGEVSVGKKTTDDQQGSTHDLELGIALVAILLIIAITMAGRLDLSRFF